MKNKLFLPLIWLVLLTSCLIAYPCFSGAQEAQQNEQLTRRQQIKQQSQEVWEKARQEAQEVWNKALQRSREFQKETYKTIKKVNGGVKQAVRDLNREARRSGLDGWEKAQVQIQEVMRRARQQIKLIRDIDWHKRHELWMNAQKKRIEIWLRAMQRIQEMRAKQRMQDLSACVREIEAAKVQRHALVYVVSGTDVRFFNLGKNANWLKENIELTLKDSNSSYDVKGFEYKQPWFPGLCTDKTHKCYQRNVDNLIVAIWKQFEECCKDGKVAFNVVAHSYGADITYDALKTIQKKIHRYPEFKCKDDDTCFHVDRLVTLGPAFTEERVVLTNQINTTTQPPTMPVITMVFKPYNVDVWKNIHGGGGHLNGIGDENNVEVNIPWKDDHTAIVEDKRGRAEILEALFPCSNR